jgi:hypothetical protein
MSNSSADRRERLDRIELLLEANAKAWAEYREWFQRGFSEAVSHYMAFDQGTQTHLRNLISTVETLGHALTATSQAVNEFVRASDARIARVEAAIDAIARNVYALRKNGQAKQP